MSLNPSQIVGVSKDRHVRRQGEQIREAPEHRQSSESHWKPKPFTERRPLYLVLRRNVDRLRRLTRRPSQSKQRTQWWSRGAKISNLFTPADRSSTEESSISSVPRCSGGCARSTSSSGGALDRSRRRTARRRSARRQRVWRTLTSRASRGFLRIAAALAREGLAASLRRRPSIF